MVIRLSLRPTKSQKRASPKLQKKVCRPVFVPLRGSTFPPAPCTLHPAPTPEHLLRNSAAVTTGGVIFISVGAKVHRGSNAVKRRPNQSWRTVGRRRRACGVSRKEAQDTEDSRADRQRGNEDVHERDRIKTARSKQSSAVITITHQLPHLAR